jgi:hypothetical protein
VPVRFDTTRASSGSAYAYVDLLQALWMPSEIDDSVPALTESVVPAAIQPEAETLMSRVARALHNHLRAGQPKVLARLIGAASVWWRSKTMTSFLP